METRVRINTNSNSIGNGNGNSNVDGNSNYNGKSNGNHNNNAKSNVNGNENGNGDRNINANATRGSYGQTIQCCDPQNNTGTEYCWTHENTGNELHSSGICHYPAIVYKSNYTLENPQEGRTFEMERQG